MNTFQHARASGAWVDRQGHPAPPPGSNPQQIGDTLEQHVARLDELDKLIGDATTLLDDCEDAWLAHLDAVAEDMRDEYAKLGRKTDPAEHTIESVARKQNRAAYSNWRRARRAVDTLEKQIRAVTAALSGRQSQLKVMNAEAGASTWSDHQRQAA